MKITYVCNEYPPAPHGGIGTFVQTLARGMCARGHEVTVVGWRGAETGERDDQGVRVVTLPCSTGRFLGWWSNRLRLHRWLVEEVRAGRTEIVETPEYDGPMPFAFDACPVVVRLHLAATTICRQTGRRLSVPQWWSEVRTLRRHRNWIAVSRHALQLTRETFSISGRDEAVIYYPVTRAPQAGDAPPALPDNYLLFAGTVSRRKGALALAEAARTILPKNPGLHLVYAGQIATERREPVDARIRAIVGSELAGRVHFPGRLERGQVHALMRRARAFVFPSTLETFGLVIAEAMLERCPVVACAVGPVPEFVEHNRTGLLVPPDDVAALVASVSELLADESRARALAEAGRESVQSRFSLEMAVEQNLNFYRGCLSGAGAVKTLKPVGVGGVQP